MGFTPFDAALGTRQGRIEPLGFTPPSGSFAFVLGSDVPGVEHNLELGDRAGIEQTVDLTTASFIRATVRLRSPVSLPAGAQWEAALVIDGAKHATMTLGAGRTRDRRDMAANVSKLAGPHVVGLQLELVAV